MCGRYTLTDDGKDLWEIIEHSLSPILRPNLQLSGVSAALNDPIRRRYNIVPTSSEPILHAKDGSAFLTVAHWWLLPNWAGSQVSWRTNKKGEKTFSWKGPRKSHFNSRWDTVTSPSNRYWHGLLDSKRCLVPADGFIEWPDDALRDPDAPKIPRYFGLHERRPFFFAGIYDETLDDEGKPFISYNILTVEPNAMLKALPHHRMPAILADESVVAWLSPDTRAAEAGKLLRPTLDKYMVSYPISTLVNSARNESPEVLAPLSVNEG